MASILQSFDLERRSSARLTMNQKHTLEVAERTMSTISILACLFIMISFLKFPELKRKTFNRLLFLASWGNLASNIATLMANSGIRAGTNSGLCKAQATLIQWFMPADCLWTFCMAVNVFLTFQTTKLNVNIHSLEKYYFVFCFGIPAIPALTFLFLDVVQKTDFYGNATIWCWISKDHDKLRIFTFYGPVWIVIAITMTLYAITGRAIHKGHVRNRKLQIAMAEEVCDTSSDGSTNSCALRSLTKCTEISQITEKRKNSCDMTSTSSETNDDGRSSLSSIRIPPAVKMNQTSNLQESAVRPSLAPLSAPRLISGRISQVTTTVTALPLRYSRSRNSIPPSLNSRLESKTNRGAQTYAQVALLLYLVMLVVWVPSTINRIYGVVNPGSINFGLNLAAALVLLLQGFFNACIYSFTSRNELSKIYRKIRGIKRPADDPRHQAKVEASNWRRAGSQSSASDRDMLVSEIDRELEDIEKQPRSFPWNLQESSTKPPQ